MNRDGNPFKHFESARQIMPREIIIDGTGYQVYRKINHWVVIDGNDIDLPFRIFRIFAILALRRDIDSGWVNRARLSWDDSWAKRYISAARMTLRAANWTRRGGVDGAWYVIEANLQQVHQYRLIADPDSILMNPEMVRFDDAVVRQEAADFALRAADRVMFTDPGETGKEYCK